MDEEVVFNKSFAFIIRNEAIISNGVCFDAFFMAVQKYCNRDLVIRGFLLVRYSARAVISRDMTELLENTASQLSTKLYSTRIRECVALKEAQAKHQDIFTYAPKSNAAEDYRDLIEEIFGGN